MDSTQRFTTRVESYRDYRPRYSATIVDRLHRECGLSPQDRVADIAAGTGLLAEIFLAARHPVIAVEPNEAMREACLALQSQYPNLSCVLGTAEKTGLPDASVQLITVGQAMHWFDLPRTRSEFVRILKPGGWCAVIYNNRRTRGDRFHEGYERILLEFGSDYEAVSSKHLNPDRIAGFFAPAQVKTLTLPNHQDLTLDGLMGRIMSSSYMPQPGHPRYVAMASAIEELFAENQRTGRVRLEYETAVSYGRL